MVTCGVSTWPCMSRLPYSQDLRRRGEICPSAGALQCGGHVINRSLGDGMMIDGVWHQDESVLVLKPNAPIRVPKVMCQSIFSSVNSLPMSLNMFRYVSTYGFASLFAMPCACSTPRGWFVVGPHQVCCGPSSRRREQIPKNLSLS